MDTAWETILWSQFGAAIDMFGNAVRACPDDLWQERLWVDAEIPASSEFWYVAYHTLFWLDFYLSETSENFSPPPLFTLSELDPSGLMPDRVYTKKEIETYLDYGRIKCRERIENLHDEMTLQQVRHNWLDMTIAELLLYTMRHVQEHEGQLSMLLGRNGISPSSWVSRAKAV